MVTPPETVERELSVVADRLIAGEPAWCLLSPSLFRIWAHGLGYGVEYVGHDELRREIERLNDENDRLYFLATNPTAEARAEWAQRRIAALAPEAMWQAANTIRAMLAERDNEPQLTERQAA